MKSKDEIIHDLEQQVSDMAMEITRLKNANAFYKKWVDDQRDIIKELMLSDNQSGLAVRSHQSTIIPPDH